MRVPTRDYSSLQQAMQTAGQAKAAKIGAKAASHTMQKFDLSMRRIDAQMDALSVQNNLAWAQFGLGVAKTVGSAVEQIYGHVQDQRKLKAVNESLSALNDINGRELASGGLTLQKGADGALSWHEDEQYVKEREDLLDGLQQKYGLDDDSYAAVRSSLLNVTNESRARQQDAVVKQMQAEFVGRWNSTTDELAGRYVAAHASDIVSDDWSGSDALRSQYDSNPYIRDKEGAWEQAKANLRQRARKQVLGSTVDRDGADAAYETLKGWGLEVDEDATLRAFIKQRKTDHADEVRSSVASYASGIRASVDAGEVDASWSAGYEKLQEGYASRPQEDRKTADDTYLEAWTSAGSTLVQQTLGASAFRTSKEIGEDYERLSVSEMFRAMPADRKDTVLKPMLEAFKDRKKEEDSVKKTLSDSALKVWNTTASSLSAQWEKGEIGTDAFVDGLRSAMDQLAGNADEKDQLEMLDYILKVEGRSVDKQIPEWLKPSWKTAWDSIEQSVRQTLGIKDLDKTMKDKPELYARYVDYVQDAQKRMLGWIRTGGRKGQGFDMAGFTKETQDVKDMLASHFIEIQGRSGTGPDGMPTGGLQNGQDFNLLLTDVSGLPLDENGTLRLGGTENATLRQLYVETGRRLDGRRVEVFGDDGPIHTERKTLDVDTSVPMYAASPSGQTLQAFIDKKSGDVYAADPAGNIFRAVSRDVRSGGRSRKEWRITGGPVGTYEAYGKVGDVSTRMSGMDPDALSATVGGAVETVIERYGNGKLGYTERVMLDNLNALDKAVKENDLHRQALIVDELRRSNDDDVRKIVQAWDEEHARGRRR